MPPRRNRLPSEEFQLTLPFGPVHNRDLLSNHWLEHRLPLEPEWQELRESARRLAQRLLELWQVEKDRVELYGNEAGLEEKFIQPVFEALGWKLKYQAFLRGREPDYALFLTDGDLNAALTAGRTNEDFWSHPALVADAKAWHINLDRPSRMGARREYPPEQIEWYLDRSRLDYAILTNGRLWRLIPRELGPNKSRFQTYLEIDLHHLLNSASRPDVELQLDPVGRELEPFLVFLLFFSPHGFAVFDERTPLIRRAIEGSSEYSLGVGEELKERVFEALRLCVEGFVAHPPNGLDPTVDLSLCQENSFVFLYRLLFIMYAEDRGLLPYRSNATYTRNRSLARHRDEVAAKLDNVYRGVDLQDYSRETNELWEELHDLFDLIDNGHRHYGVPAYNGGLFDLEANTFLSEKVLPDWYLARMLDQLGRAPQPIRPDLGLFRVDYRDLAIQQLGSVYEGLLELRPRFADEAMKLVVSSRAGKRIERLIPCAEPTPPGFQPTTTQYETGTIYLATDKGERRRTGSFYTPDHIVRHIVEATLSNVCANLSESLDLEIKSIKENIAAAKDAERAELEKRLDTLEGDFDNRVLKLKVLDPAMGSGHFLIRACQYLAEEIATNPRTRDPHIDDQEEEHSTLTLWKRKVSEHCLYGVDLNPMAVELAKLALWLETVAADAPLTFLDHHLRCGDSIIGARVGNLDSLPGETGLLEGRFEDHIKNALPALLEPLNEISSLPSETADQVKRKERIFKRRFVLAQARFSVIGDIWCAKAMGLGAEPITPGQYTTLVESLGSLRRLESVLHADWARAQVDALANADTRCFHWELSFPEVFLDHANSSRVGFDVIIGNPPYDVISGLETGQNISHLQSYIRNDSSLASSLVGKNNLYKLFICRAVELLTKGGCLGFIVPMSFLGDEQARDLRAHMLESGEFLQIHAFPQKDNPIRRVFHDAKLSTTLFVYRNAQPDQRAHKAFTSQVHPEQSIASDSPSLKLNSNSVKLYDPANITIVSCSQDDWNLATSILEGEIARLGDFIGFFQGEVNETNARRHGHLTVEGHGQLVQRGASISLYALRPASQGTDIFLDIGTFLEGKRADSKAFHHRYERVGLQESCPQNNFRRTISCRIPSGEFCNHTVNYTTERHSTLPLELVLAMLNSKFVDWYFRLGSTNAHVSHYQLTNIPCPRFRMVDGEVHDNAVLAQVRQSLAHQDFGLARDTVTTLVDTQGVSVTVQQIMAVLVQYIEQEEINRGDITRTARSHLAPGAEQAQEILDDIIFTLLKIPDRQRQHIRDRLHQML